MTKFKSIILLLSFLLFITSCGLFKHSTKTSLTDSQKLDNTAEFIDGCKEKILENYDKAITSFLKCIKTDPSNASAMYELAGIYYVQKKYTDAMPLVEKAVKLEPSNDWYQLLYANMLINALRYKEATAIYAKLAKANPANLEYYYNWAEGCIYMGKYQEAIDVYDILETKMGVSDELSLQKEKIYLQLKKPDKAIEEIEKLVKAFPSETTYYNYLADLYLQDGKTSKAYEIYQKILVLDPTNASVHLSLADYYRATKDNVKSFEELQLAFANVNLDIDTKVKIMLSYYSLTEKSDELKEQAYTLLKILIKTHPDEAKAYTMYGDFLYRDKKITEARDLYLKVVGLDSSKYAIWGQLLSLEAELNNYSGLEKESEQAITMFPEQATLYLYNGVGNYFLKKYDEAIVALNKGIALAAYDNSLLAGFYSYLGNSYYAKKIYKDAFLAFDKVLTYDPKNVLVLNNYAYYLSLQGEELDKAEKMAKKAVDISPDSSSYLDTYGWVFYKEAKYTDAETWIKKAIDKGGSSNDIILEHYGDIQYRLGNVDSAVEYWKKAKEKGEGSEMLEKKINAKKIVE
jgi:tetratricopeptide (TPR) repeat protein